MWTVTRQAMETSWSMFGSLSVLWQIPAPSHFTSHHTTTQQIPFAHFRSLLHLISYYTLQLHLWRFLQILRTCSEILISHCKNAFLQGKANWSKAAQGGDWKYVTAISPASHSTPAAWPVLFCWLGRQKSRTRPIRTAVERARWQPGRYVIYTFTNLLAVPNCLQLSWDNIESILPTLT